MDTDIIKEIYNCLSHYQYFTRKDVFKKSKYTYITVMKYLNYLVKIKIIKEKKINKTSKREYIIIKDLKL